MKLALWTIFSGSTPRCSTTIFFTRSPISLIVQPRACSIGPDPQDVRAIVVVKLPSQSRIVLIWPHQADADPANDGRLRIANIQGFNILQWCSLPIRRWFGYHTSQALTISLGRPPKRPFCLMPPGPATDSDHGHSAVDVNGLPGDVSR